MEGCGVVEGQARLRQTGSGADQLEFVLGVLADLVAREFFRDILQQINTQAAFLARPFSQAKAQGKKIFRR